MEDKITTIAELAAMVDGEIAGNGDTRISGLNDLNCAGPDEITFLVKKGREEEINATQAAAIIVPLEIGSAAKPLIRVKHPYLAAAIIHDFFVSRPFQASGISEKASVGSDCSIPAEVSIAPMAVLGNRVTVGERVTIYPGVVIGDDACIGDGCILYANVTIYPKTVIGRRVFIHSGTVIGSDGFGYATDANGMHLKRHHVGIVQIDDDVEIGANVCIDRATFGKTWIKQGAKIDNLVQIGHNVVIGEGCLIVAQVGIAGSATLGRGVVLGGQAGIKGHILLGDGVMVGGQSGVHNNQPPGAIVSGTPAFPHKDWLKASTIIAKLPDLLKELREMKKALAALRDNKPDGQGKTDSPVPAKEGER